MAIHSGRGLEAAAQQNYSIGSEIRRPALDEDMQAIERELNVCFKATEELESKLAGFLAPAPAMNAIQGTGQTAPAPARSPHAEQLGRFCQSIGALRAKISDLTCRLDA